VAQTDPLPKPGLLEKLAKRAHLVQELNQDATTVAKFYSRALNYWGVEIQKTGRLTNAAAHFERALELNPDNIVAQINLECNRNQRVGRSASVQVSKSIEDEFGKYRNWDQVIGENGPFDEPNFCFEQGRVFVRNSQYRQAAAQFDRVKSLAPSNLDARIWLGQLYVVSLMPAEALRIIDEIHAQPDLAAAAVTNRTELLFVETSAHLGKDDPAGADAVVQASLRQYPNDMDLLATATQVYLKYGRFSNALSIIEQELILAPTNVTALINQGYACIQVGAFEKAIPALTQVLTIETNNHSALLNRAIAYLRANKLAESKDDYERLQKVFPTASQISYGLGEIAWRKRDTNAAIRNYELYLANAPTNTVEAKSVIARLMELKPGAR
jgi:tetratricopeptide (TPR) repeat protein